VGFFRFVDFQDCSRVGLTLISRSGACVSLGPESLHVYYWSEGTRPHVAFQVPTLLQAGVGASVTSNSNVSLGECADRQFDYAFKTRARLKCA